MKYTLSAKVEDGEVVVFADIFPPTPDAPALTAVPLCFRLVELWEVDTTLKGESGFWHLPLKEAKNFALGLLHAIEETEK